MDLKKHPQVHRQLHGAKDQILKTLEKALKNAGLDHFEVASLGLRAKPPVKTCPPGEDAVWEPISTSDDDTVVFGWVCKPRT